MSRFASAPGLPFRPPLAGLLRFAFRPLIVSLPLLMYGFVSVTITVNPNKLWLKSAGFAYLGAYLGLCLSFSF